MSDAAQFRADQCWTAQSGEAWVTFERQLDVQLGPLGRALAERLDPQPGESVLDIGCGTGQTLLELGERVGRGGRVLGIDIAEPMLERARQRVEAAGLEQVGVVLGDAQTYRFDEKFDLEFSRLGIMFFEDAAAAFRNLFAALKPGGRLGFVCFQAREKNEWADLLLSAVVKVLQLRELPPLFQPDRPGPFFFAAPDRIRSVLEQAGFGSIVIEPEQRKLHFGGARHLEEALEYAVQVGPAARVIAGADPKLVPACRAALAEALSRHVTPEGVWLESAHFFVSARSNPTRG